MNVNYITEINELHDWELEHPLSPSAFKVLMKLYYVANRKDWPAWMGVPNTYLCSLVNIKEDSLIKVRQTLINAGRIAYHGRKKCVPQYAIHYFSAVRSDRSIFSGDNSVLSGYPSDYQTDTGRLTGGIPDGIPCDTPINQTKPKGKHEEEIDTRDGEDARGRTQDVTGRPGAAFQMLLTPRRARLSMEDETVLDNLWRLKNGFFGDDSLFRRILNTDRYSAQMILDAIQATEEREERHPLNCRIAYLVRVLEDWRSHGYTDRLDRQLDLGGGEAMS